MPKRVPAQTITVVRNGKLKNPTIGEPFEFTAEEIEQVERLNPSAFSKTRVVTVADEGDDDDTGGAAQPAAAANKPAAATKAGKPAATGKAKAASTEGL